MSTPDQPGRPGLTRKQLREIRMTGATPVVVSDADAPEADAPEADGATTPESASPEPVAPPVSAVLPAVDAPPPAVPLPRAAVPVAAPAPTPDAQVDLGVSPLTRRQAREQERIRTASVPVITPDIAAAVSGSEWAPPAAAPLVQAAPPVAEPEAAEPDDAEPDDAVPDDAVPSDAETGGAEAGPAELPAPEFAAEVAAPALSLVAPGDAELRGAAEADDRTAGEAEERPVLRPEFGSALLAGTVAAEPLAPSRTDLNLR